MKIVINTEDKGLHLSNKGKTRIAELMNQEIYLFKYNPNNGKYYPTTKGDLNYKHYFTVNNPNDFLNENTNDFFETYEKITLPSFENDRSNPILIKYVEELKDDYDNGLKIIEIPDNVKWHISGNAYSEWISEDHRTWGKSGG